MKPIDNPVTQVAAPAGLVAAVLDTVGLVDRYVIRPSAIGPVFVAYNRRGISALSPVPEGATDAELADAFTARFARPLRHDASPSDAFVRKLDRAIAGEQMPLEFDLSGVSDFGRAVLAKTAEIPSGQVRPYSWIASEIGKPKAVRAVGTALGHNPVPLLIPCHRVVRTDGRIGDYAFGSPAKRAALRAEGVDPDELEDLAERGVRLVGSDTTQVFCHPTCADARRITDGHRVTFRSPVAAVRAGFRPCRRCRPVVGADAA